MPSLLLAIVAGAVLVVMGIPSGAHASGPMLEVTNLGQPTAPVVVGQAPLQVSPRSTCAYPFTMATINACPGSWPPLSDAPWEPLEDVAGGDTLRLSFSVPVSAVAVGSTSNFPPGLQDPAHHAIPNYDVISETGATPTAEPTVWQVELPPLDARAIGHGYTFSLVAHDEAGPHSYAFGIHSPRFADEQAMCGTAYYSTGWSQGLCFGGFQKALPQVLKIWVAKYDGRVLTLDVEVPSAGKLSLGIPTACRVGTADCHRKTSIVRQATGRGHLIVKKALRPRLDASRRLNLSVRMEQVPDGLIISALKPKVHLIPR